MTRRDLRWMSRVAARAGASILRGLASPGAAGVVAALLLQGVVPAGADAQVAWRDLVISLTGSVEDYNGRFTSVYNPELDRPPGSQDTVPPTEDATASVGEMAVRGGLWLLRDDRRQVDFSFDTGVRQSVTTGFRARDYAPREWAGTGSLTYRETMASFGQLVARGAYRGRYVSDYPPSPLFLQGGYSNASGSVGLITRALDGVRFDATLDGETADYQALRIGSGFDLLDRNAVGLTMGAGWGSTSSVRVFGALRWTDYPNQESGLPEDPFRRDRRINAGFDWTWSGAVFAQLGLEGILNRSNSNRPEYDALNLRGLFNMPLPGGMALNVRAVLARKSYVEDSEFARLLPGEEADNASLAYVQLTRPLASNLDGAVRIGWTRAEANLGQEYYRRFGGGIQLNYRPTGF